MPRHPDCDSYGKPLFQAPDRGRSRTTRSGPRMWQELKEKESRAYASKPRFCIISQVFRVATVFWLFLQTAIASERDVAEWVLRWEGRVTVSGRTQPIENITQLTDDIHITGIDLTPAVMRPQ